MKGLKEISVQWTNWDSKLIVNVLNLTN